MRLMSHDYEVMTSRKTEAAEAETRSLIHVKTSGFRTPSVLTLQKFSDPLARTRAAGCLGWTEPVGLVL